MIFLMFAFVHSFGNAIVGEARKGLNVINLWMGSDTPWPPAFKFDGGACLYVSFERYRLNAMQPANSHYRNSLI